MNDLPSYSEFVRATYGPQHDPYPWQIELAQRLAEIDRIDAPTASGKTGILHAWAYALAREAHIPMHDRTIPRQLVYVIDRRLIVDSVYDEAIRLRDGLEHEACPDVSRALASMSYSGKPLVVSSLRGVQAKDHAWRHDPTQPTIIVSTIDQLGSRLLYRGYGVRPRQYSIDAGLLSNDTLIVIDEAHLSRVFNTTLEQIKRYRRGIGPWRVATMSATGEPRDDEEVLRLLDADWEHDELTKRLTQPKYVSRSDVAGVSGLVKEAKASEGQVIGVICNTVKDARQVFNRLCTDKKSDTILVTGRIRESERRALLDTYFDEIKASRESSRDRRLYVVATQTVEVGADISFDALVTACASAQALIQRAGRLNRAGQHGEARMVVVRFAKYPVYGHAAQAAWEWLETEKITDICAAAMRSKPLLPQRVEALPVLSRDLYTRLAETSTPYPIEIAPYLHDQRSRADVEIVWRDYFVTFTDQNRTQWMACVDALRPRSTESLTVPLYTARSWLQGAKTPSDVADIEGVEWRLANGTENRLALRCTEPPELVTAEAICPGDTIIVPSTYGGMDAFGWNPACLEPVEDVAEWAYAQYGVIRKRITPRRTTNPDLLEKLDQLDNPEVDPQVREDIKALALNGERPQGRVRVLKYPKGLLLTGRDPVWDMVDENERSLTEAMELGVHLRGVRDFIQDYCKALKLDDSLTGQLCQAGYYHDLGKAHSQWQISIGSTGQPLLAKSGQDRSHWRRLRRLSGLPNGWRHEVVSGQMLPAEVDPMVRHLVITHHGYCRPLPPNVDHGELPVHFDLDGRTYTNHTVMTPALLVSQWASLALTYGLEMMAWCESVVRLAHWAQSQQKLDQSDAQQALGAFSLS